MGRPGGVVEPRGRVRRTRRAGTDDRPRGGAVGFGALVLAVWAASAARHRTRYRPRRFTGADAAMAGLALLAPVAIAVLSASGETSLTWAASPLHWPAFRLLPLVALAALLAPLARIPTAPGPVGALDQPDPAAMAPTAPGEAAR